MVKLIKTYKMQTRSQTRELSEIVESTQPRVQPLFQVEIDFDEASSRHPWLTCSGH